MDLSKRYKDINGKKCDILEMIAAEPEWAANRLQAGEEALKDLDFTYKRAKVLADMLKIPVHESPEVTGTILGLVRGSVERLQSRIAELESAIVKTLNENGHLADGEDCTLIDLKRAMPTWELEDES